MRHSRTRWLTVLALLVSLVTTSYAGKKRASATDKIRELMDKENYAEAEELILAEVKKKSRSYSFLCSAIECSKALNKYQQGLKFCKLLEKYLATKKKSAKRDDALAKLEKSQKELTALLPFEEKFSPVRSVESFINEIAGDFDPDAQKMKAAQDKLEMTRKYAEEYKKAALDTVSSSFYSRRQVDMQTGAEKSFGFGMLTIKNNGKYETKRYLSAMSVTLKSSKTSSFRTGPKTTISFVSTWAAGQEKKSISPKKIERMVEKDAEKVVEAQIKKAEEEIEKIRKEQKEGKKSEEPKAFRNLRTQVTDLLNGIARFAQEAAGKPEPGNVGRKQLGECDELISRNLSTIVRSINNLYRETPSGYEHLMKASVPEILKKHGFMKDALIPWQLRQQQGSKSKAKRPGKSRKRH